MRVGVVSTLKGILNGRYTAPAAVQSLGAFCLSLLPYSDDNRFGADSLIHSVHVSSL